MSWNYSCFHAHSALLSVLQVKWSMPCQHLVVKLLSYMTLYHSAHWDAPHGLCLSGRQDTKTGFLSLICLAWLTLLMKSLLCRKSGCLCSCPSSVEEELLLTFIQALELGVWADHWDIWESFKAATWGWPRAAFFVLSACYLRSVNHISALLFFRMLHMCVQGVKCIPY